jgi:DNA polymerase-1
VVLVASASAGCVIAPIDADASGSETFADIEVGCARVAELEQGGAVRWVWWSPATAELLVAHGIRPARCWDLAAAHRMLVGGWSAEFAQIWANAHDLDAATIPAPAPVTLFSANADPHPAPPPLADAVGWGAALDPTGHLDPEWAGGGWGRTLATLQQWAEMAAVVHRAQVQQLGVLRRQAGRRANDFVHSESIAEVLCNELGRDGLPFDIEIAEQIIAASVGPRPTNAAEADCQRAARDDAVLALVPSGNYDLRNPAQVKSMLRGVGIEVDDTRATHLRSVVDRHPVVPALLAWRKAERIDTTFGYSWLDEHVRDGRLRGRWSASDGAAGRMTATGGLHNMPAELRPAARAEPDHVFVRADLGQIEPRVLAAVSGDGDLAAATRSDDMYAVVAAELGVQRDVAKVAVLGAMYGQTTGRGAQALAGLERRYPVAMQHLRSAADQAASGIDVRTSGGRVVPMSSPARPAEADRQRAAARGRYGRNAIIQGAAAELFKMWAALVRARVRHHDAAIVLCLHDELLVHCRSDQAETVAGVVGACLEEAATRWRQAILVGPGSGPAHPRRTAPGGVRFVADISVIARWSDAH